jgi:fatty-acyl-CoA synthase
VEQVYVVGVPDPRREEVLAAVVVLRDGHDVTPETLRAYCQDLLAGFKVPRRFHLMTRGDLPLTATGKVQKYRLREMLIARSGT